MDSVPLELVCRRVRETANGERPRIVSLASAASEIDRARLRAAGADEVIETPRKSPELLRAMLSIVERSSKGGRDA
jgi:DNA-binding response OmpR family regulator